MKKKMVTFFTSLVFAFCLGVGLVACDDKDEVPGLTQWNYDQEYHWLNDGVEGKHDWQVDEAEETQTCSVCGFSKAYDWQDETVDGVTYSRGYADELGGVIVDASVAEGAVTAQILAEYRGLPVRIAHIWSETVKEVAIPASVREIYVADESKSLEKITVEESNSYFSSVDGILYDKQKTLIVHVPNCLKGTVHIPDTITSLEYWEDRFSNIEVFYTGNGITELNIYGFDSLRELHLGKKMEIFGGILGQATLETVTVDSANPYYTAENGILYTKEKTRALFISNAVRKLTLPESVTYIDSNGGNNLVQLTILSPNFNTSSKIEANKLCEIYAPALGNNSVQVEGYYKYSYVVHGSLDEPSVLDEREDGTIWFTSTEKNYLVDYSGAESEFVLPETYNGQAYTVGSYAFAGNEILESVTVPSGITVTEYAFANCKNLKEAVVGSNLGKTAFSNCTALVDVELKTGVKLNGNPFENCPAVEYENGVGYVGNWAVSLEDVSKKVTVEIREGTVGLVEDIFPRPQNIEAISLPDGVLFVPSNMETLPDSVFEIYENGKYLNEWLFGMVDKTATELVVREGTTGISFNAFEIPLSKITFPKTLKKFGLYSASASRSAQVDFKGELYDWWALEELDDSALKTQFWNRVTVNGTLLSEMTEFTVKEGVEVIPENAFIQCENLQKLVLPEGVKTIENNAIYSYNLEELYLPASLENVAADAFVNKREYELILKIYYADTVEQLFAIDSIRTAEWRVLPYGELYIGDAKVTELTVPNDVQDINFANFLFKDAPLNITEENPYYAEQSGIVYNKAMTKFVYIPENVSGEIVIPEGITEIPDYAFSSNSGVTAVQLPSTLQTIGTWAFYGTSIQEIAIPAGVTALEHYAFGSCQQLVSATVPETLEFDGEKVFYDCPNLLGESYGNAYYLGRYFLKPVNTDIGWARIKEGITEIPAGAFRDCAKLLRVYVPSSVNYIGSEAFYGCSQYLGLYFEATNPDEVITEAEYARLLGYGDNGSIVLTNFNKMPIGLQISEEGLAYAHEMKWELTGVADYTTIVYGYFNVAETLTVPAQLGCNDVYMIYANAFMGNTALKTLKIEKCTVIGSYAFAECSALTSVTLPAGTAQKQLQIGTYAFYNCAKLSKAGIPANVAFIGAYAFDGCDSLLQAATDTVLSVWSYDSATGECTREGQYAVGQDISGALSTTFARLWFFNGSYTETEVKSILSSIYKANENA